MLATFRILLLAWLPLASAAPAQIVSATATGTLSIGWQGSGPAQSVSQPVGGVSASVQVATVGSAALAVGATTTLTITAESPPWPGPTQGWWSDAGADVLVTYTASAPVAGVLRLQIAPTCVVFPPMIDVEDDGIVEASFVPAGAWVDVPVVLGLRPVPVRLRAQVVNFGATNCSYAPSISFLPQPAQLTTAAVPCGVTASASLSPPTAVAGALVLHVDDAASVAAALVFGATPIQPGPSCGPALLVDGALFATPTAGGYDVAIPLVPALMGSVEMQCVGLLLPVQLQWSNRVSLTLP